MNKSDAKYSPKLLVDGCRCDHFWVGDKTRHLMEFLMLQTKSTGRKKHVIWYKIQRKFELQLQLNQSKY